MKRYRVTFEVESDKNWVCLTTGERRALHWPGAIEIFPKFIVPADAVIEELPPEVVDGYYRDADDDCSVHYLFHRIGGDWFQLIDGSWLTQLRVVYVAGKYWSINDDAVRGGALVPIA